ncbi:hypothetical protein [Streptomyces sp. NPDC002215]|uniref:hypothetical protein n=1 Tax=Streptomyces sp. NPDC002215 TaxID=3154412 RepID=UPI00332137A9
MDTALLGVLCGAGGTVLGSVLTYLGPLHLERRRERRENTVRGEDRAAYGIACYVNARAAADRWLDLLRRAHQAAREASLDVQQFDKDVADCSDELRLRTAELTSLGMGEPQTNSAFAAFRQATERIKRLAADDGADAEAAGSRALEALEFCVAERTRWAGHILVRLSARTGLEFSP